MREEVWEFRTQKAFVLAVADRLVNEKAVSLAKLSDLMSDGARSIHLL